MSSRINATSQPGSQLVQIPEEVILYTFGILDLKGLGVVSCVCKYFGQLQKNGSLWCGLFPQILKLSPEVLDMKERARILCSSISLGNQEGRNQCILNLYTKTITMSLCSSEDSACLVAISHPKIPNGSFVVYTYWTRQVPGAVIKTKDGTIKDFGDLKIFNSRRCEEIEELRLHEGEPSQFHEFILVISDEAPYRNAMCSTMTMASDWLKGPRSKKCTLLTYYGILTEKEYSEKLNFRPEHLQKIGIISAEDLKVICSPSTNIQELSFAEDQTIEQDSMEFQPIAIKRRDAVATLLEQMMHAVSVKINETNTCCEIDVMLYQSDCPWMSFQQKIKTFEVKFNEILKECNDLPGAPVEAFKLKKYNELAAELNVLVEEFHRLDRKHQIAKLRNYALQYGIVGAWTNLNVEGVEGLSKLPLERIALRALLQMGE